MTRDLGFDEGAARAEGADTAYRVANGVARVARAGAYVTGGALVAANGTNTSNADSNADSRYAGWSSQVPADPSPDAPSPVVTFPDLADLPAPVPVAPPAPFAAHPPAAPDVSMVARSTESERRPEIPGSDGDTDIRIPGAGDNSSGFGLPGYAPAPARPGLGFGDDEDSQLGLPNSPGFGLPGHGIGIPGFDGLPGNGVGIPGFDGIGLPGGPGALPGAGGSLPADGPFDGIGDMFDGFGAMVNTEWQVDAHVGLDGVWFTSQMKVTGQVGQVGDQLDDYGKWLGDGLKVPGDTTGGATGGGMTSPTGPSLPGSSSSGVGLPGTTTAPSGVAPAPAPAPALAHTPVTAPAPAPAPIAPAPAPVAPVAPAPVATSPVVSTPLQTTIQPDAASTPIANVFGGAGAASPLTAPAASVPALFAPTKPVVVPDVTGGSSPSTVPVTVPSKQPTVDLDTPTTVKLPDLPKPTTAPTMPEITKQPQVTVPPTAGNGGTKPTFPDDDVVTKPGTTGGVTAPSTNPSTPTVDVPDPTVSQPTATVPTQQPTAPTQQPTMPTKQPTVDIDPPTVVTPPPVVTVQPTVAPVKPPVIDTKPIAAEFDHQPDSYHGVSAGLFDSGVGGADLSGAVFPAEQHGYDFVI
ncbi:hypothetical protein [Nocardia rhizosphaerihabitans]|uniref:Uncharacterized protein n=1 Tax=Nocardia rhizosphaerihabitans TaxID=1691570 RepID=A0ABQ2KRW9_9NOCA|nr:hypothetical protein [Nocardia rhizosphaerihabitans]GGN91462.1 hypothetical protein GCM10011610_51690 [Nocardia rhizosphaerihabitans]